MAGITLDELLRRDPELRRHLLMITEGRSAVLARRDPSGVVVDGALAAIVDLLDRAAGRCVVGIGGFPGAGKTSLAIDLVRRLNAGPGPDEAVHLPMDGFHFRKDRLRALGRDHIKGHVSTFDVESYLAALHRFVERPSARQFAPDYDRNLHETLEDRIEIGPQARLLVTEGIYVGLAAGRWGAVSSCLDLSLFLDVEPRLCLERIVARNAEAGRNAAVIGDKLRNDLTFMRRSLTILAHAGLIVRR
jgi:pantothenate kinase